MSFAQPWLLAAAAATIVLLGFIASRDRRQRAVAADLARRDERITSVEASLNLLESRAVALRQEIALLERQRDQLVVVVPDSTGSELRKKLAGRLTGAPTARATAR